MSCRLSRVVVATPCVASTERGASEIERKKAPIAAHTCRSSAASASAPSAAPPLPLSSVLPTFFLSSATPAPHPCLACWSSLLPSLSSSSRCAASKCTIASACHARYDLGSRLVAAPKRCAIRPSSSWDNLASSLLDNFSSALASAPVSLAPGGGGVPANCACAKPSPSPSPPPPPSPWSPEPPARCQRRSRW
eukprot:scaffold36200_cov63-Phaeocystis_antarctica.AAC.7